jgi:hypothetical protein
VPNLTLGYGTNDRNVNIVVLRSTLQILITLRVFIKK